MPPFSNLTLAELAIHDPRSIWIFEKFNIDYYQQGSRTLKQACMDRSLDYLVIHNEFVNLSAADIEEVTNFNELGIVRLIEYIETKYHSKEKIALPLLYNQIVFIRNEFKERFPAMEKLAVIFKEMVLDLIQHASTEEKILFPYVRKMAEIRNSKSIPIIQIPVITNPITKLEFEHAHTDHSIDDIRKLTNNYFFEENAPIEYKILMAELFEFEKDFHKHIHLENNVLFPKIIELEADLLRSVKEMIG